MKLGLKLILNWTEYFMNYLCLEFPLYILVSRPIENSCSLCGLGKCLFCLAVAEVEEHGHYSARGFIGGEG